MSMAMAMAAAVLTVVVTTIIMEVATATASAATTYTVGAPDGLWDMQTDYAEWVKIKTFHPGDKITFTYSPELHDLVDVTAAGYGACSSADNISAFRTGNDVVALTAVGTRYFLCGLTGHCGNGMKIRVDVVAATGPAAAGPATGATPAGRTASSAAVATASGSRAAAAIAAVGAVLAVSLLQLAAVDITRAWRGHFGTSY